MQITRFLSLNDTQFLGCLSAFLDSLEGELQATAAFLQRLADRPKGSGFGFEMQLDRHRYGALIVLERWSEFARAFAPTAKLSPELLELLTDATSRVSAATQLLERTNRMIDAAERYSPAILDACTMAFRTVQLTFHQEQAAAAKTRGHGAILPEDFQRYRNVFLGDLAIR